MKTAAEVALAALLLSVAVALRTTGYDALRIPVAALAATVLVAAGGAAAGTRWRRAPAIAYAAFVGAHVLSWLAAPDGWAAVIATIPVAVGFAVFAAVSRGWVSIDRLHWFAIAAAVFAGGMTLASRFHKPLLLWVLGNTNYAGIYCALLAALLLGLAFDAKRRLPCIVGASAALAGLAASGSRSGMIGFGAAVVVLVAFLPVPKAVRIGGAAALAAALLAAGVLMAGRADSMSWRLEAWKGTPRMALAHAVVGAGAGNFQGQYPPYRREAEARLAMQKDARFREVEDPHNTHLAIACELGIPGTLAWLSLLATLGVAAIRRREAVGLAGIAAFAVAGMGNTLTGFTPFDGMFGLFAGLAARGEGEARPVPLASAAGLVAGLGAVVVGIMTAGAEHTFRSLKPGSTEFDRLPVFQKALEWWPAHYQAKVALADDYASLAGYAEAEDAPEFLSRAIGLYERARSQRAWNLLALSSEAEARRNLGQAAGARRLLDEAIRVAPWHHLAYHYRAFLDHHEQGPEAARETMRLAIEKEPRHAESYYFLGVFHLIDGGDPEPAIPWLREARKRGADVRTKLASHWRGTLSEEQWDRILKD
jgi:tetratricopeptide (TPR) repeat protein